MNFHVFHLGLIVNAVSISRVNPRQIVGQYREGHLGGYFWTCDAHAGKPWSIPRRIIYKNHAMLRDMLLSRG